MWYLWTVKGKAPWEYNIGRVYYPEDKAAVMKMDEWHADRQRMNAEKAGKGKGKGRKR